MRLKPRTFFLGYLFAIAAACGGRTGLGILEGVENPVDAGPDSTPPKRDGGHDADVADVTIDQIQRFDANKPDVQPPNDCPDAAATLVYVITADNQLLSFYPPTLEFKLIGVINCPAAGGQTPFSMGVDRKGNAFVVFTDGNLFQVSTATASCKSTSFQPNQDGFTTFGMGFTGDTMSESLFISESDSNTASKGLATIDTTKFTFNFISDFTPSIPRSELTGTGDGRLFAYWPNVDTPGSSIAQINPQTAVVTGIDTLQVGDVNDAFAFAFWGGDFWVFTAPQMQTTVTQFDPMTLMEANVTTFPSMIVGAGVSTCAPQ